MLELLLLLLLRLLFTWLLLLLLFTLLLFILENVFGGVVVGDSDRSQAQLTVRGHRRTILQPR